MLILCPLCLYYRCSFHRVILEAPCVCADSLVVEWHEGWLMSDIYNGLMLIRIHWIQKSFNNLGRTQYLSACLWCLNCFFFIVSLSYSVLWIWCLSICQPWMLLFAGYILLLTNSTNTSLPESTIPSCCYALLMMKVFKGCNQILPMLLENKRKMSYMLIQVKSNSSLLPFLFIKPCKIPDTSSDFGCHSELSRLVSQRAHQRQSLM